MSVFANMYDQNGNKYLCDIAVTPVDYEPPGFMSADHDNFAFEDEPMTINVGDVATVSIIRHTIR